MHNKIAAASWLFLIGSFLFTADAAYEALYHFSPAALIHLSEGILFLTGSFFFMPDPSENCDEEYAGHD